MTQAAPTAQPGASPGTAAFRILPFAHPQGCRGFLIADPLSGRALALDVHQDQEADVARAIEGGGWKLAYVVDSHTHADHPSAAAALAKRFGAERVAHVKAAHQGVTRHPQDGEQLPLGRTHVTVLHAPGHTPDHLVLVAGDALFSGDSLLIGAVARTDFLGGDAGELFDTLQRLLARFPDETLLYPGHDYQGRVQSTLGAERATNPWLAIREKDEFVRALTANPPPRPANMDALLRANREGVEIPAEIPAAAAARVIAQGGARSIIDVRTPAELAVEHVPGALHVPLAELGSRLDDVLKTPAPRLLLCRSGARATTARKTLAALGVGGLSVVSGGIEAVRAAGGETVRADAGGGAMSIERQVRVAAGLLIFVSVLLGLALHPLYSVLAGFVGAGLVYSGVMDRCGIALLLARMPWNAGAAPVVMAPRSAPVAGGTCAAAPPPPSARATPPPSTTA